MCGNLFGRKISAVVLCAAAVLPVPLSAGRADDVKWGGWIDAGGKIGTKRDIGEVDLFLPVAQDDHRLLFLDLRGSLDDQSQREGNFGLGYRQMLDNGWNLGGYGFFDRRRSETGHFFSQATVGAEALGEDFDLRLNGYVPLGRREYEVPGSTRIDLTSNSIRMSNSHERAYHGGDAELGWRVPVFAAQSDAELRVYGGGYWFDAPDSDEVAGPRLRMELRLYDLAEDLPGSRLTLSGEVQRDQARGTQEFLGFKLRLPLQPENQGRRLSAQERRMMDPVVRDVDIVTQQEEVSEPVSMNGQTLDRVTQLSGSDVQAQLDAASPGSLLLLSGTATVTSAVTLPAGQTLRGGGGVLVLTGASSGRTVTYRIPGASGVIKGAVAGDAVLKMSANSSLSGIIVENTSTNSGAWAVSVNGASGVSLRDVSLVSAANGLKVSNGNSFTLTGSRITAAQGNALEIGNSTGIAISDSTLTQNGASALGIRLRAASGSIRGNTVTTNGNGDGNDDTVASGRPSHGISISDGGGLTVSGNTVTTNGTQANGLHVENSAGITISDNRVTTNNYMSRGIRLINSNNAVIAGNTVAANTTETSSTITQTISYGMFLDHSDGVTVRDNTVTTRGRSASGLYLFYSDDVTMSGNTVTAHGENASGIYLVRSTGSTTRGNTLAARHLSSSSSGLYFGTSSHNGLAENNTISSVAAKPVGIYYSDTVTVRNNRLVGQGDGGVWQADSNGTVISGNTP